MDRIIKADPMATFIKDETINRIREHINLSEEKIYIGIHRADVSRLDTVISEQQITAIAFIIIIFTMKSKKNK